MKDIMEGISPLPVCVITGRIAGDFMACGDCYPCTFGSSMVPQVVKNLMAERDEFANKYANEAGENDIIRELYPELVEALFDMMWIYQGKHYSDKDARIDEILATLAKCKAGKK